MHTVSGEINGGGSSPALKEALGIFQPSFDVSLLGVNGGFIDVLGSTDVIASRASHQVVHKKNFPRIYERLWRPIVSRVFFGLFGMGARKERQITLEMLDVAVGDRVLDVGCGPGNYTKYLADASGNGLVVGVDASGAMLTAGVRDGDASNLAFVRADACALPFIDRGFDVVCCVGTIHMIETPMAALGEMVRMLAPGGRIGIMTTCDRRSATTQERSGITIFARDDLPKALSAAGLVEVEQRVFRRAQLISARRPREDTVGR